MSVFRFKFFELHQHNAALKVGTDAMILGALIDAEGKKYALDIGTGTGVLSLMLAQRNPSLKIAAVEIDEMSAMDAQLNFDNSPFPNHLELFHQNIKDFKSNEKFDLIFTNPPFYETSLTNKKQRTTQAKHQEGLPFSELFTLSKDLLSDDGCFWMILPSENSEKWIQYAQKMNLHCLLEISIFGKPNQLKRSVLQFGNNFQAKQHQTLIIRGEDNTYTEEYKSLTRSFHGVKL